MTFFRILIIVAIAVTPLTVIAKECATCGSTLTDKGRCPYCQPKPKVLGQ